MSDRAKILAKSLKRLQFIEVLRVAGTYLSIILIATLLSYWIERLLTAEPHWWWLVGIVLAVVGVFDLRRRRALSLEWIELQYPESFSHDALPSALAFANRQSRTLFMEAHLIRVISRLRHPQPLTRLRQPGLLWAGLFGLALLFWVSDSTLPLKGNNPGSELKQEDRELTASEEIETPSETEAPPSGTTSPEKKGLAKAGEELVETGRDTGDEEILEKREGLTDRAPDSGARSQSGGRKQVAQLAQGQISAAAEESRPESSRMKQQTAPGLESARKSGAPPTSQQSASPGEMGQSNESQEESTRSNPEAAMQPAPVGGIGTSEGSKDLGIPTSQNVQYYEAPIEGKIGDDPAQSARLPAGRGGEAPLGTSSPLVNRRDLFTPRPSWPPHLNRQVERYFELVREKLTTLRTISPQKASETP